MKLVTEYLVIVEKEAAEAFYALCGSVNDFNKLLQTDPDIVVRGKDICYKLNSTFKYEARTNIVKGKAQRFFQLRIEFEGDDTGIDTYTALLRSIKGTVQRTGGRRETLWDDLSLYYSYKSYPLIHKAETLMRKLITYFMLTNVGTEWLTEASPNIIKEAIDKSKRKQYFDILHQLDFIHLGDLLFKVYQTRDVAKLYGVLGNANRLDDLKLEELKAFVPTSNWEKYFSKFVDCTDEYLDKRWKQLYELRCMVAHNALIGKSEHERITQLVGEVEGPLQKAIDSIGKIDVPQQEREQVAEIIVGSLSVAYGDFIQLWKSFETALIAVETDWGLVNGTEHSHRSPRQILTDLRHKEVIDDELFKEALEISQFRNRLVHDATASFSEQETRGYIVRLEDLLKLLRRSWKDEIVSALRNLGGSGSLASIYDEIENNSIRKLPETWKATVRYTLQLNSSDSETFKRGGQDLFCHLSKGLWGLRGEPKAELASPPGPTDTEAQPTTTGAENPKRANRPVAKKPT